MHVIEIIAIVVSVGSLGKTSTPDLNAFDRLPIRHATSYTGKTFIDHSVALLSHDVSCGDSRTIEQALVDEGVIDAEEADSIGSVINSLARGVMLARTSRQRADLTFEEISGRYRRLSDTSPESRRDVVIAALELAAQRAAGVDPPNKGMQESFNPKLDALFLEGTKIDIVKDSYDLGEDFIRLARKLPCMKTEVEPDQEKQPLYQSNDPALLAQFHLGSGPGGVKGMEAWDFYSGSGEDAVAVAIVDTGCSAHPDLEVNFFASDSSECFDENLVLGSECFGYDFGDDDSIPFDEPLERVHGTPVAGLVSGRPNNEHAIAGICYNCKIHCLKVWDNSKSRMMLSAILRAHDYILRKNVKISNHSYGGYGVSRTEEMSIAELRDAGHLFVAAAGNDNCNIDKPYSTDFDSCKTSDGAPQGPMTPASYTLDNILTVCATTEKGELADFSNFGPEAVDLCAPGSAVVSIWNTLSDSQGMARVSGTSFAAPIVAGVAALLWGSNPSLTYREVKAALMDVVPSHHLKGASITEGIVDAQRALERYGLLREAPHSQQDPPIEDLTGHFYSGSTSLNLNFFLAWAVAFFLL